MELLKNLEGMSADEQMTAVVELQKAAMKTLEDQKQASIGKSAELVIQGLKKIKSDFEAKFDSLNYDIQTKVASLKDGEQGLQGPKGEQGDRGLDGSNGRDGRDGKDGKDGLDGVDGVGVRDAKIDFDGSLVISLTDGREINCGEVVSVDVAKQIQKVTHNIQTGSGGDSQTVLDAIAALQATIATYGTMATQNANNVAITGGTIDNTTIGATTPSTGVFTTLTATTAGTTTAKVWSNTGTTPIADLELQRGTTSTWGGDAFTDYRIRASGGNFILQSQNNATAVLDLLTVDEANNAIKFSPVGVEQMRVNRTASAVNYVQVTGAATGGRPAISVQGSDNPISFDVNAKGSAGVVNIGNGGTYPFFKVQGVSGQTVVNYLTATGTQTTVSPSLVATGTDTNISQVFQSKGTGAIDLAAGSSGVNISNGGTVTALTVTSAGSAYTTIPTPAITAPTTAGGVQATATATMSRATSTIVSGGTGYTLNDTITVVGGTFTTAASFTVSAVSGGVVTALAVANGGTYSVLPTGTLSTTGGTGTGLTLTIDTWSVRGLTITNAGSGYVEQPTVTFSGGGGSGAAAYATVGSNTSVKSLGSTINFATPGGTAFSVADTSRTTVDFWQAIGSTGAVGLTVAGATTNNNGIITSKGTGYLSLQTNAFGSEALRATHTASAVNYVQVTGAATGNSPIISAQGSDANAGIWYYSKGFGGHRFYGYNGSNIFGQFYAAQANPVNYLQLGASSSGNALPIQAVGSDTNIDLTLTPKGTGNVRFGTYTGTALSIAGYIEIKDSGGTVRKLAVVA